MTRLEALCDITLRRDPIAKLSDYRQTDVDAVLGNVISDVVYSKILHGMISMVATRIFHATHRATYDAAINLNL